MTVDSAPPPVVSVPAKPRQAWGRILWRGLKWVVGLAVAAAIAYWMWLAPMPVAAHVVQRGEVVAEVMGTGTLESHISASISPKISGLIRAVLVDQGDRVEAGQVLVQLDDGDLSRQVEVAESALSAAHAAVERRQADRARALAVLDQARFDFDRVANLVKLGTGSTTEFEDARKTLRVSEADLSSSEAALVEAQKQVVTAMKTLELHQTRLADASVRAPFAGLITRRDRDPGDIVVPGSSILALVAMDELWLSAWGDETQMAKLQPGQPARVVFRAAPGRSYPGAVARLGREVDRETREFLVDVHVHELPENWAIGQRAEIYIETGRKADAVLLPSRFIGWQDGKAGTFVESGGRAAWRPLGLGLRGQESVEIIEGLSPNERAIVPATQKTSLKPGQRVKVPAPRPHGSAAKEL